MNKQLLLLLFVFTQFVTAQNQDALVFFADKENVQQSIDNPITILSQAAIDRKALQNTPIDERDVPVNEDYITQVKNQAGITVLAKSKWMNCVYVRGNLSSIQDLISLSFVDNIEYADKTMNFAPVVNTPMEDKFAYLNANRNFNYGEASNQIEMISGDYLHDQGYTGEGMIIAVLDSGFPGVDTENGFSYVRDDGRILGTYDFVERSETINNNSSHGTRTFSDIGGYIENQFVGTAPDAAFYLFKTEDVSSETPVEEAYWVEAIERADSLGVHVVNTSLGYRSYDNSAYSHSYEDLDGQTTIAARGANHGFDKGLLMVTSAGNSGSSGFPWVGTPGDAPGVLTIGAVTSNENYASFSSIGPTTDGRIKPDVMAQGQAAYVITEHNEIVTNNGTSFSSPITAGSVACLWQAGLQFNNEQIMQWIKESAHLYNNPTNQMGYGIPDFQEALNTLVLTTENIQNTEFSVYPNPVSDQLFIETSGNNKAIKAVLYSTLGTKIWEQNLNSQNQNLNFSELRNGVYLLTLATDLSSQTIKIVKK